MKPRFAYPLLFLLPSAMVAFLSGFIAAGAGGGILWVFVYGDNSWPRAASNAVMALAVVVAVAMLVTLLFASYSFGKAREVAGGLAKAHVALALAISVLLPALVLLHQWQVGNLG
jgi:uncharacterized membrane protein